nr:hypothetical protein [Tanacetum cinerariifolium]
MIAAREPENQGNAEEPGDEEEQGTDNAAAEEPVTVIDDVADQSIQSPTPLTPPPQQSQDIPSTSQVQSPPLQQQSLPPAQPQGSSRSRDSKAKNKGEKLERANKVKTVKLRRLRKVGTSQRIESSDDTLMEDVSNQEREFNRVKDAMKETEEVREYTADTQVEGRQADIYHIDMDHAAKVLSMQEDESEVQEAVKVVTTAKLITEVVVVVSETVSAAAVISSDVSETISAAVIPTVTALSIKVAAPVKAPVPSTRRKRGVNTVGFTLDYFKGMSYDDIRPIFLAKFNANMEFLLKSKEQIEEEESRVIATINETPAQKATK